MSAAGEFSPETVAAIVSRDQGRCVDCGEPLTGNRGLPKFLGGWSLQHREARGQGGGRRNGRPWLTLASNGTVMCGDGVTGCHGKAETSERRRAFELGFAVRVGIRRPSAVPMLHAVHGWVLLDDEGGWSPVDAPEDAAVAGVSASVAVVSDDPTRLHAVGDLVDLAREGTHGVGELVQVASQARDGVGRVRVRTLVCAAGEVGGVRNRREVHAAVVADAVDNDGGSVLGIKNDEAGVWHGGEATAPEVTQIARALVA